MMSALRSRHPKYRTKLCRNFVAGDCPFGQKCSFVHPAPRISPPASLLAQQLSNWGAFLPQLLALSQQQATRAKMPRRSPPRFQGPRLIDEDPSPSGSLLLSTSDCTSSEQIPEPKRSNTRKKYPCRHFVRTGGWCPAGAQCRFHHDVAALPDEGVQKAEHAPPDPYGEGGRTISGGVLMGVQLPSPPTIGHGHSEPAQHHATRFTQPYQPTYWPSYAWQPYQPYYATAPPTTVAPIYATAAPPSVVQHGVYPPCQVPAVPPNNTQTSLPLGTYEVNGTTYFPTSRPSVPAPPPATYSMPIQPVPYSYPMPPACPYNVPPPLPPSYYDVPNQTTNVRRQTSFDPFGSDRMTTSQLPVIPQFESYQISPIQQDVPPLPVSSTEATGNLALTTTQGKPTVTKDSAHEFPYRPPQNQRIGHARRISVNVKKHERANSG